MLKWLIGIVTSIIVAWLFGEKAAVRYEKRKEKEERLAAHQSLINQVRLVEELARCNIERAQAPRNYDSLIRLPVAAFETAFVSEKPPLSNHPDLLRMVNTYLAKAYTVNAAIDTYLSLKSSPANQYGQEFVKEAGTECRGVINILDELSDGLKKSMDDL